MQRNIIITLFLTFLLFSCMEDSTREGKGIISVQSASSTKVQCYLDFDKWVQGGSIDNYRHACSAAGCPIGTTKATSEEKEAIIKEMGLGNEDEGPAIMDAMRKVTDEILGLCIPKKEVRPEGVTLKQDYCACNNGEPDIHNSCEAFCTQNDVSNGLLYVNTLLAPDIELNSEYQNLYNWCTKVVNDAGPSCALVVTTETGQTRELDVSISANSNSFTVNISDLAVDKTYIGTLIERTSGVQSTNSIQIIRLPQDTITDLGEGPLKIASVSRYACIDRFVKESSQNASQRYFEHAIKQHYYYASSTIPVILPASSGNINCHDTVIYGKRDDSSIPRLDLVPTDFLVWDQNDVRFTKSNGATLNINQMVLQRIRRASGERAANSYANITLFAEFKWPNGPNVTETSSTADTDNLNTEGALLGYFMQPWIDYKTGRTFCPEEADYNGPDPLFQAIKEFVGVPTEAIYLAERTPLALTMKNLETGEESIENTPQDVLIIKESLLKKIWFYTDDSSGERYLHNSATASKKPIRFYWPPDTRWPLQKRSHDQVIYDVKHPNEIGNSVSTNTDSNIDFTPGDKRFGCVPASEK